MEKKNVVFGHIGRYKDKFDEKKPSRWRPSLLIFEFKDFPVHCYHLLYNSHYKDEEEIVHSIKAEIARLSKNTEVVLHPLEITDPFNFQEVYTKLYRFCDEMKPKFYPELENYYFTIGTNTHVWQISVFLAVYTNLFPGKILQTWGPNPDENKTEAGYSPVDLDLGENAPYFTLRKNKKETNEEILKSGIKTKNSGYNELINKIEKYAANSETPILLLGKTGVGKTYLARRIFEVKKNARLIDEKTEQMTEMDCTTIPETLLEGELFGYKKGAFTGAVNDYKGRLLEADKSVLFIDEIGNLSMYAQAKLLKVMEDKKIRPLGGKEDDAEESNFQLICATNKNLIKEIEAGNFREDLFARFDVLTFELPELRERKEDIGPYIEDHWLKEKEKNDRNHIRYNFTREAWNLYIEFAESSEAVWKANFRALNSSLERMCIEARIKESHTIDIDIVLNEIAELKAKWENSVIKDPRIPDVIDSFNRVQLEHVLDICDKSGSLADAGRKLYNSSLSKKESSNDSDRLRKYLNANNLKWDRREQRVVFK